MALRLIRSNNSGRVTVYDDAVVFHSAKGNDYTGDKRGGVFEKVYNAFGYIADNVNKKFIIKSGMGMLYGRQFALDPNETVEFDLSALANQYIVFYFKIENKLVSGEEVTTITLEEQHSGASYPSLGNTDLITNRYGTATMELYRVRTDATSTIIGTTDRRYIYRAGYAEKARMMDAEGVINSRKVGNLIYSDRDLVINTDHAYYADRAGGLGQTGIGANRNKIDDNLYMEKRDGYLLVAKEVLVNENGNTLNPGTHTFPHTAPSGNILGALIYGNNNLSWSSFYGAIPGSNPLLYFEKVDRVTGGVGRKVKITITTSQIIINIEQDAKIEGSFYIAFLMLGTRA